MILRVKMHTVEDICLNIALHNKILKSIFYKKGAKKSQLHEICRILPRVNSTMLHGAIFCKFRATAIFSSFLIKNGLYRISITDGRCKCKNAKIDAKCKNHLYLHCCIFESPLLLHLHLVINFYKKAKILQN